MRYIYAEPTITTITDEELVNDDDIYKLLKSFQDAGQSIQMTVEDPGCPDYLKNYENVRITAVRPGAIDFHAFFGSASMKHKDVPFHYIRKVRVVANKATLGKKYRVTRFHNMDVAEIE